MSESPRRRLAELWPQLRRHWAVVSGTVVLAALTLRGMGRTWWCTVGDVRVWSGDIWTAHNSQHIVDPYTLTHVLHGVALYGLLWLALGNRLSPAGRFPIAIALQAVWEVLENTNMVIERYRETTISLNYYGDSVANSLADMLACAVGYVAAAVLPTAVSVLGFVAVDVFLLWWIRDSLALNVLMLLYPIDAVHDWQARG